MQHEFRVGGIYRDTESYRNSEDQFFHRIRGFLNSDIINAGGNRDLGSDRSDTSVALIIVSNDARVSQHEDLWDDTLAVNSGYVSYWGDTKKNLRYDESTQNRKIKDAFDRAAPGRREEVPPCWCTGSPRPSSSNFVGFASRIILSTHLS